MTLRHRFTLRTAAAGTVLGLAATTAAVLGTTTAASAATINFDCTLPILGDQTFAADLTTNAPATMPSGTEANLTGTVAITVPEGTADTLRTFFSPEEVGGTIASTNLVNDVAVAPATITVPKTTIPASGPITLTGTGALPTIKAGAPGTSLKLAAGNQAITMVLYKTGADPATFNIPCVPSSGQSTVINTISVTAAPASTTSLKAKYAKKSHKAKVTATVSATGATPTGTVTFTLKKGKKVKTKTVAVTNGVAKATFKKVTTKGKYKVTGAYAGSVGASSGTATFKVR